MADVPPNQLQGIIDRGNAVRDAARARETASRKVTAAAQSKAKEIGMCGAAVSMRPTKIQIEDARKRGDSRPLRYSNHLCDKDAEPGRGKCREHYLRDILHVSRRGRAGGIEFRPFRDWQVPLGAMSAVQEALLADAERLPLPTPYVACIEAMNAIDPTHPLKPILERPARAPKRSRSRREA